MDEKQNADLSRSLNQIISLLRPFSLLFQPSSACGGSDIKRDSTCSTRAIEMWRRTDNGVVGARIPQWPTFRGRLPEIQDQRPLTVVAVVFSCLSAAAAEQSAD